MEINKIKILIDAVKLGSFTKCAEKYSYSPSALPHIADSIETELGVKILNRTFNGITLTNEGKKLLPYFENLLFQAHELLNYASSLGKKQEKLIIGCYSSVSKYLLPNLIVKFKQKYPSINITIAVGNSLHEMYSKNSDVFIVDKTEDNRYEQIKLLTDEYVAVVKSDYYVNKKLLTISDFNKYPFIMPANSIIINKFSNITCDIININADDDSSIISMIKNGLGISVLPQLSTKNLPKGIKTIKLSPTLNRELFVLYPRNNKNLSINKFIKFISSNI